jgi:ABC-type amino acid transport substrate-binding protein
MTIDPNAGAEPVLGRYEVSAARSGAGSAPCQLSSRRAVVAFYTLVFRRHLTLSIYDQIGSSFREEKTMRTLVLGLAFVCLQISASVAGELTGTLKRIDDTGQMNLGFRESEPPMSLRDRSGNPVGYSIDLCDHIAAAVKQKLGRSDITVNYVPVTAENRFTSIESAGIDILCGATTKTLDRSERVGFTQLTFVTGASLLSRNGDKVRNILGLKGKRVAVVFNTTTIEALKGALNKRLVDAEVVPVSSAAEGMALLDKGEVDAFSSDQVVLIGQVIARNREKQYFLSEELFSFEPFALAVTRGDVDFQLVADRALSRLNRSGQIAAIYRKWFGRFGAKPPIVLKALYQLNATPE